MTVCENISTSVAKRNDLERLGSHNLEALSRPSILIIVTGGTICMTNAGISDSLKPVALADKLEQMTELHDIADFDVLEWVHLLDSSDVDLEHWIMLAHDIEQHYLEYDGFVILHGTDTLAYTASALSFMLENLNKPVILTGAMLPLTKPQSDAKKNLAVACMIAASAEVTEVCVVFNSKLLRGNRSRKLDCSHMDAFDSPNYPPLGTIGVDVFIDDRLLREPSKKPFRLFTNLDMSIATVTITPGFQSWFLWTLFSSPKKPAAVILKLYGSGTCPVGKRDLLRAIQLGLDSGIAIVALTQTTRGTCSLLTYENGAFLDHMGVIEGRDMTPEACLAKLAYLMGKGYRGKKLKSMMEKNLRGEMTEKPIRVTCQAFAPSTEMAGPRLSGDDEVSLRPKVPCPAPFSEVPISEAKVVPTDPLEALDSFTPFRRVSFDIGKGLTPQIVRDAAAASQQPVLNVATEGWAVLHKAARNSSRARQGRHPESGELRERRPAPLCAVVPTGLGGGGGGGGDDDDDASESRSTAPGCATAASQSPATSQSPAEEES